MYFMCVPLSGRVAGQHRGARYQRAPQLSPLALSWNGDPQGDTWTIQDTPKRSATTPKRGEKNVLVNGICTCPPSAREVNARSAAASFGTVSDSEKPWKLGRPLLWQSAASTVVSPMRKLACITLFSAPGGTMPGALGSGLSLKRSSI